MNRLKIMRKVKHLTQKQVADIVGVTQNAYCYWELEKVRVDVSAYKKLAQYYGVSTDFLMGMRFHITVAVEKWPVDIQADYRRATEEEKVYLEYKYGNPKFTDSFSPEEPTPTLQNGIVVCRNGREERLPMSEEQLELFEAFLAAYRKNS